METIELSFKKGVSVLVIAILVVIALVPSLSSIQIAEATDFTPLRSWVNVEIPYYVADNILVKISAVTIGNHLNDGMWIDEVNYTKYASSNITTKGPITIKTEVYVAVGRAIIEAEYSANSNTTRFIYTVSSAQYEIKPYGDFPNDGWGIKIVFHTNFKAEFDPRTRYCLTPSPNYYGSYTTTYNNEAQGYHYYVLNLDIVHPSTFKGYVDKFFITPIIFLIALAIVCTCLLWKGRKNIEELYSAYIAICSAVIVFIPIFMLSIQELKTPFKFIWWFDGAFLFLLTWFIIILMFVLIDRNTELIKKVIAVIKRTNQKNI